MRMRRIILTSAACRALPYFATLSHKRQDFRGGGGNVVNIKRVFQFSLQLSSENFLILKINQRDIINIHRSSCKVPLFLSDFNKTQFFLTDFRKIPKYKISWKSIQWQPHSSMQTDAKSIFAILRTRLKISKTSTVHLKIQVFSNAAVKTSKSCSYLEPYSTQCRLRNNVM
jgi:hypothetical protein